MKLFCGGMSGVLAWGLGFPFDSLKLRMQTNKVSSHLSIKEALMTVHKSEGILILYKGVHV